MEQKHAKYQRLLARCRELPPAPTAVAHPCDESSLRGAVEAAKKGIIAPLLIGPRAKMEEVAGQFDIDITPYEIINVEHSRADSVLTRLASCAVAALVAADRRQQAGKAVAS